MALPVNEPLNEIVVCCQSTSIGATPVAASVCVPVRGRIVRTGAAVAVGTSTGSGTIAITTTGSATDIGALIVPIGAAGTTASDTPSGGTTRAVNEGDFITFTPASAGGANIVGTFFAVIRK